MASAAFGTACSPCCAIYAVQRHALGNTQPNDTLRSTVERNFYLDNCLKSIRFPDDAKQLVDGLRGLLGSGGFEIQQWACNMPNVTDHLPREARSDSIELWLSHDKVEPQESTLGLRWNYDADILGYKHRPVPQTTPTMQHIYKVTASQYDSLGFILPFTTRAKILIQQLWNKQRDWDDPMLPTDLLKAWNEWENELPILSEVTLPRCYVSADMDKPNVTRQIHIFCDASE